MGRERVLDRTEPLCDHCGGGFGEEAPQVWPCVETRHAPRAVILTPEMIEALPGRPASGGRSVIDQSDRRIYYNSAFHLCAACYQAAAEGEGSTSRQHRLAIMIVLAVLLAVGAVLWLPGVLPALTDLVTGRSDLFYDFAHHPITVPTTPYRDPFPGLPSAPARQS